MEIPKCLQVPPKHFCWLARATKTSVLAFLGDPKHSRGTNQRPGVPGWPASRPRPTDYLGEIRAPRGRAWLGNKSWYREFEEKSRNWQIEKNRETNRENEKPIINREIDKSIKIEKSIKLKIDDACQQTHQWLIQSQFDQFDQFNQNCIYIRTVSS